MDSTSESILVRVRHRGDHEAWRRFVQLYTPMLYSWCGAMGLQGEDADDLVQDVFTLLLQKLPEFQYDRDKSFRAWLHTVLRNKWREQRRRRAPVALDTQVGPLADMESPEGSGIFGETEYRRQLVRRALEIIRCDFEAVTWKAWEAFSVAGRPAADVAEELGISVHAVYLAKSRVLRRLRQELDGLLD